MSLQNTKGGKIRLAFMKAPPFSAEVDVGNQRPELYDPEYPFHNTLSQGDEKTAHMYINVSSTQRSLP